MKNTLRGLAGLTITGFLAMAMQPSFAAERAENQLVGIKLWRGFKDVLAKHGQPTRIEIGAVTAPAAGGGQAGGPGLMGAGGPPGAMAGMMGGSSGMMMGRGGGKMGAMMGGQSGAPMMGGGALPGLGGMGSGGQMMGSSGMMMGGGKMGAMMGNSMRGRRGAMGDDGEIAGMAQAPGSGGPVPGFGLGTGVGMGGSGASGEAEGEVTWVYERPGGITYMFLFNKDGRVIQIQEFGYRGGGPTGSGIALGDPVSKVYGVYGWANSSNKNGNQLTLDYSQKHHVALQLMDQGKGPKVIGITLAITERGQIPGQ